MRNILSNIASSHTSVTLELKVSNFYEAVAQVKQDGQDADAIIARGQTAQMIKESTDIPVIEIPISIFDVLHANQLAENFHQPYAILGFPELTNQAKKLKNLLGSDVDIYTLGSLEEADSAMQKIRDSGCRLIVVGMGTEHIARRYGLNTIQVNTSQDSLESAFREAEFTAKVVYQSKKRRELDMQILSHAKMDYIAFRDRDQSIVSEHLEELDHQKALDIATKELQLSANGDSDIIKGINQNTWDINRREFSFDDTGYTVFYFHKRPKAQTPFKQEMTIYSKDSVIDILLKHFPENSMTLQTSSENLDDLAQSQLPVLLLGEKGTGKNQIAASIYTRCHYQNHPYYQINFSFLGEKSWNSLFTNMNSPVLGSGNTLFFQNLDDLPSQKFRKMVSLLRDSSVSQRNKLIFSYSLAAGESLPDDARWLMDELGCLDLRLKPLRERRFEMHTLINLYLATQNLSYGKHVVGFTENAERLMSEYAWPGNLAQFNRIINKLVAQSSSGYIQESEVADVLHYENENFQSSTPITGNLDIDRPLVEIEADIVRAMLARTNGNKSLTAHKLRISRTTLWRFMQSQKLQIK